MGAAVRCALVCALLVLNVATHARVCAASADASTLPRKLQLGVEEPAGAGVRPYTARPLIGIFGAPINGESPDPDQKNVNHTAYIAASYVKARGGRGSAYGRQYVESAGARAVPLVFAWSDEELERRLRAVNGLLLPGGGADLCHGRFAVAGRLLLQRAKEANDAGEHFPVWGTCLGFEQLAVDISGECNILGKFDAEDDATPLVLTAEAQRSRLFGAANADGARLSQLATSVPPLAMENHMNGAWEQNAKLAAFFRVVTYSLDRNNSKYVSTIEGRDYPIFGTQWHPEKNSFEWTNTKRIPHSADATLLTQGLANFLVAEARKNARAPASEEEELALLMYNYPTTFTGKTWPSFGFDQVYFFDGDTPFPAEGGVRAQQ